LTSIVVADIPPADVVTPHYQKIRLFSCSHLGSLQKNRLKKDLTQQKLFSKRTPGNISRSVDLRFCGCVLPVTYPSLLNPLFAGEVLNS
jgi:hypothetical protein